MAAMMLATVYACGARAGDVGGIEFSLNGFGTLGVVHSDYDQADFVTSNPWNPHGVGYSGSWGADQDSKLGLQVTASMGRFTAIVQGITKLRYDNTFRPYLEWANLKYDILPTLSVRIGRVVLPTLLSSDTENVGYVRPWVRTPAEVPIQLPITNSDGVDVSYLFKTGGASHRLQLVYGENKSKLPWGENFDNTDIKTVADTIEYGALTLHLAYQNMDYSVSDGNGGTAKYAFKAFEAGVSYEPEDWFITAEQYNTRDEGVGHTQASYIGTGYRIANFTPFLLWSKIRHTSAGTFELKPFFDQQTWAAGLRWDFMGNVAAKLQYGRSELDSPYTPTSFINLQPGFQTGDRAHIFSATIDFVW
jgi:hypothetical protein